MNMPGNIDYRGTRILRMVMRWRAKHFRNSPDPEEARRRYERVRAERLSRRAQ